MKNTNSILLKAICLVIVAIMLLSGCKAKKPNNNSSEITGSENQSSNITSSEEGNLSSDNESTTTSTDSNINSSNNQTGNNSVITNTGSEDDKSSQDNNSEDESSKPSGDEDKSSKPSGDKEETSKPSGDKKPVVENTNKPSTPSEEDKEDEEVIDGKITKPDADALTSKKAALKGKKNKITNFKLLTEKLVSFNLVEFDFNVPNLPADVNVYKEDELDITMKLTGSNGKSFEVDAFYFEEYEFTEQMQLKDRSDKPSSFRFRVSPQGGGTWDFTVTLKIKGKEVDSLQGYINVAKDKDGSQILEVEPNRKQTFITRAGEDYVAIGENLAWNDPITQKTRWAQYIANQMKTTAQYGANYTRIWDTVMSGSCIKKAVHVMDQGASAQWDYLFETAEDLDYYIVMTLQNHAELSATNVDHYFHASPFNSANGGYLDVATDIFTDRPTMGAIKTYLRYVISRWGYSEHLMSYELVNELDHAYPKVKIKEVREWLKEMADYLRENDPYNHMVSNSTGNWTDPLATYHIFDFMYFHWYNYTNLNEVISWTKSNWITQKRPVLYGEWGVAGDFRTQFSNGENVTDDLTILHHGNWMGVMGGAGGTGFSWWWEDVDKKDAHWTYQVVSEIAEEIPWSDPGMFMTNTSAVNPSNDQIESTGYRGEDYAYLWFYDKRYTVANRVITTFENETAHIQLKDGTYHVRWVDTWTGKSVKKEVATAKDGYLKLNIPKFTKDIVVAITVD